MSCLCQICGRRFYDDDHTSNPLAHFCIGLDGPAIVHEDADESAPHTPEIQKSKIVTEEAQSIQLPAPAHSKEDLAEIARLRQENEKLRSRLDKSHKNHVVFAHDL